MATIILGGGFAGNWIPLLIPLVLGAALLISSEYIFKFIKKKLRGSGHSERA
jgi:hypothetical protein